jgi:predicted nucleotidyltransferase
VDTLVSERKPELVELCRRFHVQRLELFGSAASGSFDPQRSDLDFLVEFEPLSHGEYSAAFFALKEALEQLFGRSVDLVVPSAIRNPYFRQSVEQRKALLYAA